MVDRKYHTINVYQEDVDYLDKLRKTPIGKVSFADIVEKVCEIHRTVMD